MLAIFRFFIFLLMRMTNYRGIAGLANMLHSVPEDAGPIIIFRMENCTNHHIVPKCVNKH